MKEKVTFLFRWHIPMAIATRSQPNPNGTVGSWLHNDVAMQYFLTNTSEWFVVNAGGNGVLNIFLKVQLNNCNLKYLLPRFLQSALRRSLDAINTVRIVDQS